MKNIYKHLFALIFILVYSGVQGQNIEKWHELDPQQQKEILDKLRPEERMELFRKATLNEVVHTLKIPQEKIGVFSEMYIEYQMKIHQVKDAYPMKKNIENLNEAEARKTLENSFIVAQKLLEIRKEYTHKFQSILPSSKVLQLFRYEGQIRKKIMEKSAYK